jgi:UDP-N-acetylmuramoyl-tripeptide--D-alanyl-D-alanine ligase
MKEGEVKGTLLEDNGIEGFSFMVEYQDQKMEFICPVPGTHNLYNALGAISAALSFQIPYESIREGLKKYRPVKMRMQITKGKAGYTIINDAYNANPESMKAAFGVLRSCEGNKKIAVLGDMLELGEFASMAHAKVGREAVNFGIDTLICYGEMAEHYAIGAKMAGLSEENIFVCNLKEKVIECIRKIALPGDVILFKGSRGMKLEEVIESIDR